MQVKGPIDWFEVLETSRDAVRLRLKTFEGEEYELELARGDSVRAAIPLDDMEEADAGFPAVPPSATAAPDSALDGRALPEELARGLRAAGGVTGDAAGAPAEPPASGNPLLEKLEALEPELRSAACPECGGLLRLAVAQEGVVALCRRCGASLRIDAELLQRLADALELRCFACGEGALRSEAEEYANILKCQNPACAKPNSWRGVSDRLR